MYYSQFSEDKLISEYIDQHNIEIPQFVVEIGAAHVDFNSNSRYFIESRNYQGLLIEPNETFYHNLVEHYQVNPRVTIEQAVVAESKKMVKFDFKDEPTHSGISDTGDEIMAAPLSEILHKHQLPTAIGILSVDTEGYELPILESIFKDQIYPEFVMIESNTGSEYRGAKNLMTQQSYELVIETAPNYFWDQHPLRRKFRKALKLVGIDLKFRGVNTIWRRKH
jgi:FkbM family methyltransferase